MCGDRCVDEGNIIDLFPIPYRRRPRPVSHLPYLARRAKRFLCVWIRPRNDRRRRTPARSCPSSSVLPAAPCARCSAACRRERESACGETPCPFDVAHVAQVDVPGGAVGIRQMGGLLRHPMEFDDWGRSEFHLKSSRRRSCQRPPTAMARSTTSAGRSQLHHTHQYQNRKCLQFASPVNIYCFSRYSNGKLNN